jgi:hypothetical protein
MIKIENPLFERYELTPQEEIEAKFLLANPILQGYIRNIVATELLSYMAQDMLTANDSFEAVKIVANKAFNNGLIALGKRLIIIAQENGNGS